MSRATTFAIASGCAAAFMWGAATALQLTLGHVALAAGMALAAAVQIAATVLATRINA